MEKREFRINFKKYRNYCIENGISIPNWFNHLVFNEVMALMKDGNKLQACKFLTDKSKENGTRTGMDNGYVGPDYGLKWSKNDVADVISHFEVIPPPPPYEPNVTLDREETKNVLAPFVRIVEANRIRFNYSRVAVQIDCQDLIRFMEFVTTNGLK